jgi:hypothetical protein
VDDDRGRLLSPRWLKLAAATILAAFVLGVVALVREQWYIALQAPIAIIVAATSLTSNIVDSYFRRVARARGGRVPAVWRRQALFARACAVLAATTVVLMTVLLGTTG